MAIKSVPPELASERSAIEIARPPTIPPKTAIKSMSLVIGKVGSSSVNKLVSEYCNTEKIVKR